MNINQEARYALIFLSELRRKSQDEVVTIRQVVDRFGLSDKFMEQVVRKLKKAGIVWSLRGRGGGYGLKCEGDLTVSQVFEALGQRQPAVFCPFPTDCRGGACCDQREIEAKIVGKINDEMSGINIVI
jgi:Rrf2 family protein